MNKQSANYVYYVPEDREWVAICKGYEARGATEKEAIKNLQRDLKHGSVSIRHHR